MLFHLRDNKFKPPERCTAFTDYHEGRLFTDAALFNQRMSGWLVFYNTELPHLSTKPNPKKTTSLKNLPVSPIEFLLKSHPQSRMYWTNTKDCQPCIPIDTIHHEDDLHDRNL